MKETTMTTTSALAAQLTELLGLQHPPVAAVGYASTRHAVLR
jgi:hypothetical protein